jgi:hypothetical protein
VDLDLLSNLNDLRAYQAEFDIEHFSGTPLDDPVGMRRHIMFHLAILLGKLARTEEREDHGISDLDVLRSEVIPDLLIYAAQFANLYDVDLLDASRNRLVRVRTRETADQNIDSDRTPRKGGLP